MVKKLRLLHMVTLYNTYTRYTHAHYQEFIAVKFLRGLVVIAISQFLDLRKNVASCGILVPKEAKISPRKGSSAVLCREVLQLYCVGLGLFIPVSVQTC